MPYSHSLRLSVGWLQVLSGQGLIEGAAPSIRKHMKVGLGENLRNKFQCSIRSCSLYIFDLRFSVNNRPAWFFHA